MQIFTGLYSEGNTDNLFLESIIKKTCLDVAFNCKGYIEVDLRIIKIDKGGLGFVDQILEAAKQGYSDSSILLLFVHTDADKAHDKDVFDYKINPAIQALSKVEGEETCKILVSIVPIYETESWMLADTDILKKHLNTKKSDLELGLNEHPETISNPKERIIEAIRISKEEYTKRQRHKGIEISDLYQIIGQELELEKLEKLSSFIKFRCTLIRELISLNLLDEKFFKVFNCQP